MRRFKLTIGVTRKDKFGDFHAQGYFTDQCHGKSCSRRGSGASAIQAAKDCETRCRLDMLATFDGGLFEFDISPVVTVRGVAQHRLHSLVF